MSDTSSIDTSSIDASNINEHKAAEPPIHGLRARAGTAAQTHTIQTAQSRDDVMALRDAWHRLEAISVGSTAFQSFDIYLPWMEAYAFGPDATHKPKIVSARDPSGKVVAILPLAEKKKGFITTTEWIGEPLIQYGDILLDPMANLLGLRADILKAFTSGDVSAVHLRNVRADSRIMKVLELEKMQVGATRQAGITDLSKFDDPADYWATFSRRTKKNRNKKRRGMAEIGPLSIEVVEPGEQGAFLGDLALEWKKDWLAERGLSSRAFLDRRALACLSDMFAHASDTNPMRICVLRAGEHPVAIEVSLVSDGTCIAFMGSYDAQYEHLSPGTLQMEALIEHGFENGWKAYDMLAPMTEYKERWSTDSVPVADYILAADLWGLAYRDGYIRGFRPLLKSALMALPASVRGRALSKGASLASL